MFFCCHLLWQTFSCYRHLSSWYQIILLEDAMSAEEPPKQNVIVFEQSPNLWTGHLQNCVANLPLNIYVLSYAILFLHACAQKTLFLAVSSSHRGQPPEALTGRVLMQYTLLSLYHHSKHQKERALCSWWPAPPNIFADDLVVFSGCQTALSPVVSWLRDVGLGGQEQPDP